MRPIGFRGVAPLKPEEKREDIKKTNNDGPETFGEDFIFPLKKFRLNIQKSNKSYLPPGVYDPFGALWFDIDLLLSE